MLVLRRKAGSKIVVAGFTGPYTMLDDIEGRANHLVHICAESGAVPKNRSFIKRALVT